MKQHFRQCCSDQAPVETQNEALLKSASDRNHSETVPRRGPKRPAAPKFKTELAQVAYDLSSPALNQNTA